MKANHVAEPGVEIDVDRLAVKIAVEVEAGTPSSLRAFSSKVGFGPMLIAAARAGHRHRPCRRRFPRKEQRGHTGEVCGGESQRYAPALPWITLPPTRYGS